METGRNQKRKVKALSNRIHSRHGMALIVLSIFTLLLGIFAVSLYAMSYGEIRAAETNAALVQSFYIAEAGVERQLANLNDGDNQSLGTVSIGQGEATVIYVENAGTITSAGSVPNHSASVTVTATVKQKTLAASAEAALKAASNITTNGQITIDGRDHDPNGNLTGAAGIYGVAVTTSTYVQSGSSQVGGNGIAPANPHNPATVLLNASPLPPTPEEFLGLEPGDLDSYKTSTAPAPNFSGIIYFTGDAWQPVDFGTFSSGIVIVHNADGDALMKNIHGSFNGLIITDKLEHLNGDMVVNGAIITTTQDGNVVGNGSAEVNYSSEVLAGLTVPIYEITSWQDNYNNDS